MKSTRAVETIDIFGYSAGMDNMLLRFRIKIMLRQKLTMVKIVVGFQPQFEIYPKILVDVSRDKRKK